MNKTIPPPTTHHAELSSQPNSQRSTPQPGLDRDMPDRDMSRADPGPPDASKPAATLEKLTDSKPNVPRTSTRASAWEPLRHPLFRMFWLASLASNLGTWIHEVGAGWLMTMLDASPEMVASVRTSMTLPIVFLAIPAGVLADRIDKRKLLMMTQGLLLAVTAALAVLTFTDHISAWGLLALTFVMGLGMVIHVPTWQAAIPELVPRSQIPQAVGLGSISFNLARTLGPALGGVLIAILGLWSTFAFNAFTFACVIAVLSTWKRTTIEDSRGRSFWASTRQGVRFVARHAVMRNVMLGVALFVIPGSVLWSLLPLYAKTQLGWGAQGFGVMVACVGAGAVVGASILPRLRHRFGSDRLVAAAMSLYAGGLIAMSFAPRWQFLLPCIVLMGAGWMATLTTLTATAQITLPPRLRARGMGCYLTMMAGSMAFGSLTWGQIAGAIGIEGALLTSGAVMLLTAAIGLLFPLSTRLDD
ncbi:Predicted arabinose efflux permease, MFS family [Neorhodopirellula lusitana]|uniref:Predicted arabinose efflux permease, MFS family n=1 Tax=Neorhodopirellula lusitana TaxID=445327 RepID=A0ABY1Q264_9BACT|nr:MFS transporter [Neorhodopirellula lusitana]SMP57086.1 Predicted arabinose efflux permease, MFS family [Neorhodopirellula lusitana]